ncbi:hypothetical protein J3R30DRAFT_1819790 [Lentinula aciculospora]|uniref:Uncharacterized protein n=1 Tax=Lentinula aciculospora TaxID=153920 RepID=A0A9W9AIP8_9AGAR|nr:hypothetical protein J3R30DRAFT_1819790 [Lentinula aciculospora]
MHQGSGEALGKQENMSSPLTHFSCLDDVIQVIYHLNRQLFLLSKLQDNAWVLHIGLLGPDSRWWRGTWDEHDIFAATGSKASSDDYLEMSERLLEYIKQGELYLSGWSKESSNFNLILGPSSEKPSHFQFNEISAEDAASYAAEVFCSIARDAQSRKCQLYGSSIAVPVDISTYFKETPASTSSKVLSRRTVGASSDKREEPISKKVVEQPVPSKKRKERKEETQSPEAKTKAKAAPNPIKGASLANPTKKARKYQAVQFDSDED